MRLSVCNSCVSIGLGVVLAAASAPATAATDPYVFKILKVEGTSAGSLPVPGSFPQVTFMVTTPTGTPVLLVLLC